MTIRVLCILPIGTDARISKRVDMLRQVGFRVEALGFERSHYLGRRPDCPFVELGDISNGRYGARIRKLMLSVPKVRAAMRRNDVVYAFNADMALLALLSGSRLKVPVVVEAADIREIQVAGGLLGRTVRAIDKLTTRACRLLVLTTDGYSDYYRNRLKLETPSVIIENKVDGRFAAVVRAKCAYPPKGRPLVDRPLRIGWFGYLRDEWSLRVLDSLMRTTDRFSAVLAGPQSAPCRKLSEIQGEMPNSEILGPYDHPTALPALYGRVDMALVCYPPGEPHGWSRSNRYYDACLFQRPIIVRAGCGDADQVRRFDIGLTIASSEIEAAAAEIRSIEATIWDRWRANMAALPPDEYTLGNEDIILRDAIKNIVRGSE